MFSDIMMIARIIEVRVQISKANRRLMMNRKSIFLGISLLMFVLATLLTVSPSQAGFIKDDPSLGSGIQQFAEAVGRNIKETKNGTFVYPLSRDGRFIVYPGTAFAVQFYLPKDTCFKVKDAEYKYMTNDGEPCEP